MHRVLLIFICLFVNRSVKALPIIFDATNLKEITFDDLPITTYSLQSSSLTAEVKKSSSLLLMSFATVRTVHKITFEWQLMSGELIMKDAAQETSKKGDDFIFRIGLLIHGKEPFVPFFAPGWIKKIRGSLSLPTDRVQYYVVGAKSTPGSQWKSPYSSGMDFESLPVKSLSSGWNLSEKTFDPVEIVGIWIMADGDNTGSSFTAALKDLLLE